MSTTASAHPNIALVKYWGKAAVAGNVPATPSLSITLDTLCSTTTVETCERDEIELNGTRTSDPKIAACLANLRSRFEVPPLRVVSQNNFPTAAGLASSASGFAALVTAIDAHCELGLTPGQRSDFARQASGSAARSIFGGFVGLEGPDWMARPLLAAEDWPLRVVIAVTDTASKSVSSSVGMTRSAETSAYYPAWVSSTAEDYAAGRELVATRDFAGLAALAENSCLKMHALMMSSRPAMLYWRPATLACIEALRELQGAGTPVFFTIDAGPQLKAVCLPEAEAAVAQALSNVPGVVSITSVGLGSGARLVS